MRQIDADALLDAIDRERETLIEEGRTGAEHVVVHHARRLIEDMPTVDAVRVVRCKDCWYFQANNAEEGDWSGCCTNAYLPMNGTTVDGWWFCADGRRG